MCVCVCVCVCMFVFVYACVRMWCVCVLPLSTVCACVPPPDLKPVCTLYQDACMGQDACVHQEHCTHMRHTCTQICTSHAQKADGNEWEYARIRVVHVHACECCLCVGLRSHACTTDTAWCTKHALMYNRIPHAHTHAAHALHLHGSPPHIPFLSSHRLATTPHVVDIQT